MIALSFWAKKPGRMVQKLHLVGSGTSPQYSTTNTNTTPEEAGRQAEAMARRLPRVQYSMDTVLAHSGVIANEPNAAMAPALHLATTYVRPAEGPYRENDAIYTRMDNPTRCLLEHQIARLKTHGRDVDGDQPSVVTTCAFASGMMAVSSIILAHKAPLHIVLPIDLYHGVPTVLMDVFSRFQVTVHRVDMRLATQQLKATLQSIPAEADAVVWIETPSNPLCHVIDIQTTCDLVHSVRSSSSNTTTVVDSTLAPPTITQPLWHGADLVLHSGTKYLGGHSDVLLGIVTASPWTVRGRDLGPILRTTQIAVGGVASAMDSWLALRSLKTLSVRTQQQSNTALQLATYLNDHPSVLAVYYPGLQTEASPKDQSSIANRQMKNGYYGGVLSIEMDSESKAMALAGALRTIKRATSLGGTETLIEHRKSIEPEHRATSPAGLLRIAVGLEDPGDLIQDLKEAIQIADQLHR